ncbi:MAG: carbohydrate kinase family protein [bacterium]
MYDIITFGSASRDIFLRSKKFREIDNKGFIAGKGLCLPAGSKIRIDDIHFSPGGGGANTAVTFVNQGFKTAFCGMIGDDPAGNDIVKELKGKKINTEFVFRTKAKATNQSVVLSFSPKERTILVYRGAAGELSEKDIPWSKLKSKWFYLAPLSDKMVKLFEKLIDFAKRNKIKVALNPGNAQLALPKEQLKRILRKVDILILNKEEASLLTGIPYQKEKEIFQQTDLLCPGITIMTKGSEGAVVSDGKYLYRAPSLRPKAVEGTGAGDSFASGFLSGFIQKKGNIEYAIQLAMANSAACLQSIGAQNGLLKKTDSWKKTKVEKETCSKNGLCFEK